jgi:hypothetical protein
MIGVVIVPGHSSAMHGLDAKRSLALLPVGDRPILQHIVEALVAQKITKIELIVDHAPETVEALLGNGDRWGCKFRYHLAAQAERPYRSLKIIPELKTESWALIHAESFPCVAFPSTPFDKPALYYGPATYSLDVPIESQASQWKGTAMFPSGAFPEQICNLTREECFAHLEGLAAGEQASVVNSSSWLDASSPGALLHSQMLLLERRLDGLMLSGTEREPGVWVSRNVVIHPSVQLVAPLYIGPNSRLNRGVRFGPNAVIEGECIVDTNTSIQHSLITAGSYIGEALELDSAVVDRNLLMNVRLGTSVNIMESFLIGGLKRQRRQNLIVRIGQSLLAVVVGLLLLPITLLAALYYAVVREMTLATVSMVAIPSKEDEYRSHNYGLPCIGSNAWSVQRQAGWSAFTRQFLPGLLAVAAGRLGFVGLPPRSSEEISSLPAEWKELYLAGVAGLITEAALSSGDPDDATQRYIADAYYLVQRSFTYNLKLALKYFLRLIVPA